MFVLRIRQPTGNFLRSNWTSIAKENLKSVGTTSTVENAAIPEPVTENQQTKPIGRTNRAENTLLAFRYVYPEFLPDPNFLYRNKLREKLERIDMLSRRQLIDIPEFYVVPNLFRGSILAVHYSDPHSQGKSNKFVGICIDRINTGLRASIVLRNVIDHQGVEMIFELYDPTIQKVQVLRLEKRLDDKLYYLRDADKKYSTFDVNMEPEILPEGAEVPINKLQIELKPKPWHERWERRHLRGVVGLEKYMSRKMRLRQFMEDKPWEKYDLMKQYRSVINEEEQTEIWSDVYAQLQQLELTRKKMSRKRTFVLPKKTA